MNNEKLTILWTSGDKEVATKVVLRYIDSLLSKSVWKEIELLIWGPSVNLSGKDREIGKHLKEIIEKGVDVKACIVCADEYDVSGYLDNIGVKLEMLSEELTHIVQNQDNLLSF